MASHERTDPPPAVLGQSVSAEAEDAQAGARMSFLEHLEELRRRIIYSLYALFAAAVVPVIYADHIYKWMLSYFHQVLPPGVKMIYTQAADGFMFKFELVLLVALLIASPFVFAQIWLFVAPGLYTRERKVVIPFVICASALFFAGAAFSHYLAFIMMWKFLGGTAFSNEYIQFVPTIGEAFSLYIHITIILGIIFEMPVFVFFLTRFGLITWQVLAKQWKYAIVGSVVVAAIVTPSPDYFSQFVVALPMLALYGVSIGVAWVFRRREAA
jgi:sec-independent protein translocase protein TatC